MVWNLIPYLVIDLLRQTYVSTIGQSHYARSDVYRITQEISSSVKNVSNMNSDSDS